VSFETIAKKRIDELERALRELVEAEDRYVRESGMTLTDDITRAVAAAKRVLR